ncbi:MAG: IS982 family transposase [Aeromicrobium sp.]|uniref:IS982 family transposase n=1 Tax=Aeromicrobium sp. TaxID=1871063 RepID=UPI0039E66650
MDADLDTALYVTADDLFRAHPERVPARPKVGIQPALNDAEIVTLAVISALLGYDSERHFLRYAHTHLIGMFPDLTGQSGFNKRLRALATTMAWLVSELAAQTSVHTDDVRVADSTPVECGRSRETVKRSELAGWAEYGYCASHSRFFWGLRLHLVTTLHGLPVAWALTGAKANEREVFETLITNNPALAHRHDIAEQIRRQVTLADKGYNGREFEASVAEAGIDLLRPARRGEEPRPGQEFFKPLRQVIESVNDTFKGQLSLERHGGRTIAGVCARVAARVLALTTAIWHNDRIDAPVLRSLTAYDH